MSIEEPYNWIFNVLNTSNAYNFFFLWQGTYIDTYHGIYIDKNLYFSVGSTSVNAAVDYLVMQFARLSFQFSKQDLQ